MEKLYIKHYILATYNDNEGKVIRTMDMSEVVSSYELVTDRIRRALLANDVEDPERHITYSFRMLGDFRNQTFHRKQLVEINLDELREHMDEFPWEDWGWVQAFQPLVDVAGYTIVEIDSEYQSFGAVPVAESDYIQPCYRIYEGGAPDWDTYEHMRKVEQGEPIDIEPEPVKPETTWYGSLKENIPTALAIITSAVAITIMLRSASEVSHIAEAAAEQSKEILKHIEDSIDDAIDMPQIVRVELGDDIEVIGTGRRTW